MIAIILFLLFWVWMAIITAPFWIDDVWPNWRISKASRKSRKAVAKLSEGK